MSQVATPGRRAGASGRTWTAVAARCSLTIEKPGEKLEGRTGALTFPLFKDYFRVEIEMPR